MLSERGVKPPAALVEALRRHAIEPIRCESPFIALARLCELAGQTPVALLLVHPDRLPEGEALRVACERYTPTATCWVYDESSRPRLRAAPPVRPGAPIAARHEATGKARLARRSPTPAASRPAPRLRLVEPDEPNLGLVDPADAEGANPVAPGVVGHGSTSPRSILTDDELDMLMAPDMGPDLGRHRGPGET
jgi:hypothetical protein